jgi:ATP-dependent Clp protease ATP-binding subunit ClpC
LDLDTSAKDFLIEKGYNPDFGARPLRRAIEQFVEDPISEEILRGGYKGQSHIEVTVHSEVDTNGEQSKHLFFEATGKDAPAEPEQLAPEEQPEQADAADDLL